MGLSAFSRHGVDRAHPCAFPRQIRPSGVEPLRPAGNIETPKGPLCQREERCGGNETG